MTDQELLEMAAKAAGIQIEWVRNSGCYYRCEEDVGREEWNPLADDGDAFRLMVKLGISIEFFEFIDSVTCFARDPSHTTVCAMGDLELRRAIVMTAAEIGKAMP